MNGWNGTNFGSNWVEGFGITLGPGWVSYSPISGPDDCSGASLPQQWLWAESVTNNGGANAGHTVYHDGKKVVTHLVPIGVLFGIPSVIGLGCVVNIKKLEQEIKDLNDAGFNTDGLIFVDERAHLVLDKHIEEDSSESKIGTTRQGIGPTYRDKYNRTGMRMKDLGTQPSSLFSVIDIYELFHNKNNDWKILCEGAQGFQIDIDWGDYPYVTSSHCTIGSAVLNGIPPQSIDKVFGIMKAYETYSGFKTTFQDENDPILQQIVGDTKG